MLLSPSSLSELPLAATKIIANAGDHKIFLFYGDMGAGKTTLIKSICVELGVSEPVTSPTFSIVNEYRGGGKTIYHFDFYRLKAQTEAYDLGYEEYFYSGAWCFIEWPEKLPDLLPGHYMRISMKVTGENSRQILVENI